MYVHIIEFTTVTQPLACWRTSWEPCWLGTWRDGDDSRRWYVNTWIWANKLALQLGSNANSEAKSACSLDPSQWQSPHSRVFWFSIGFNQFNCHQLENIVCACRIRCRYQSWKWDHTKICCLVLVVISQHDALNCTRSTAAWDRQLYQN